MALMKFGSTPNIVGWRLCRGSDAGVDFFCFRDLNEAGARQKCMQGAGQLAAFREEVRQVRLRADFSGANDPESFDYGSWSQEDIPARDTACIKRTYDFPFHPLFARRGDVDSDTHPYCLGCRS
jgi:hypothetical protein